MTRATIATVSKQAGVSISTVSQVMRGSGRISQQTRDKVLEAAKAVNYVRDKRAAAMRSGHFREVGLLIHHIANPFNAEVLAGVSDLLEQHDYLVYVLDARDDAARQQRYLETLIGGARGGLLWVPAQGTDQALVDLVLAQKVPTVTFLRSLPGANFDHVGIENADGTRAVTEYLVSLGHRHIAYLGGACEIEPHMKRISGYLAVMEQEGLGLGAPVIWPCEDSKTGGAAALPELLRQHPQITGLVCNGDMVAMGATLALARMGKTAGKEISVVGFDNTAEAALWTPPLTTLAVNPFGLGQRLAQTLLERIEKPQSAVRNIQLPGKLEIRQSSGPVSRSGIKEAT
ncbi:MAG: LacI family DNA-binding transcriptional regulator [Thiothrix litoralis]